MAVWRTGPPVWRKFGKMARVEEQFSGSSEHVPNKLLDFLDQDMLQLIDIERFLFDHISHVIGKRSATHLRGPASSL
jgi:hypothetical protein